MKSEKPRSMKHKVYDTKAKDGANKIIVKTVSMNYFLSDHQHRADCFNI